MVKVESRFTGPQLVDLSGVRCHEVRALIALATRLRGWQVHTSRQGVTFDGAEGHSFSLPANASSLRHGVFKAKARHLVRYATGTPVVLPAQMAELLAAEAGLTKSAETQLCKALAAEWPPDEVVEAGQAEVLRQAGLTPPPEDKPGDSVDSPTVVSQVPARSRRGYTTDGVTTYDSPAAWERRWSDGTVDYPCRDGGCTYVGTTLRSTANHYATAHSRGKGRQAQPEPDGVAPLPEGAVSPRVARLAAELRAAMEATGSTDPQELAAAIVEARTQQGDHDDDTEPFELTAEQVLDRIARLVDRGETSRLRSEVERRVEQLGRALVAQAQLAEQVEALAAERDQARGTVMALRDLLTEAAEG